MSLQINKEERENRELVLTIVVDQARVDGELRKAAKKLAGNYRIPGFRPGKAPYHVIAQQVGLPALYNEFVEPFGQTIYQEAIAQEGLEPYARASLEEVKLDPLTYTLAMPLDPHIDLGDYRALRVEEDPITIDEAAVETRLDEYRDQQAGWVNVERPSEYGDMININVRSILVNEDGSPVFGEDGAESIVLDENDWDVTPDQENPMEPPGFDEALLGLMAGDEKEVVLSWPADGQSMYAGKQARFSVKVNHIQAYQKAELTDEFVQTIGPDFNTLEDLKESIRATLRERATAQAENNYLEKVLDAMLAQSKLNYPPVVIEDQLDSMLNDMEVQLRRFGIENLDSYLKQVGQSREQMREGMRTEAKRQAERNLIISEVLRAEALTASDEEVEARIAALLAGNSDPDSAQQLTQMFRHESGRAILESQLLREKALQRIAAIAHGKGDEEPAAVAEPATEATTVAAADTTEANAESAAEPATTQA